MKLLRIYLYGEKVLRKKAEKIDSITPEIKALVEKMIYTMQKAPGVGLAAPQIGISKRLVIVTFGVEEEKPESKALINPEIIWHSDDTNIMEEGCLSIPDTNGDVQRWTDIKVKATDIDGNTNEFDTSGFTARIIQHEIDHLDGVLFIDRLSHFRREMAVKRLQRRLKKSKARA